MKNITTIKKTALASKTAFASKVALATILLGFLFVGWGANSLQAQERKTGWFVGLSPYAMDLNLEKTTKQPTNNQTNNRGFSLVGLLFTMLNLACRLTTTNQPVFLSCACRLFRPSLQIEILAE